MKPTGGRGKWAKPWLTGFGVVILLTTLAVPAWAEWFADVYVGAAMTLNDDLTITEPGTVNVLNDVDFDTSFAFGGRGGYWFETPLLGLHFGVAMDVSHFSPDLDSQVVSGTENGAPEVFLLRELDLGVTALSLDLMLRWQLLTSPEFPKGRLQPYFTVGPTLFIAHAEDSTNFPPARSNTDIFGGVTVGAGVAWFLVRNIAIFGEYRFTHFDPEFEFTDGAAPVTLETDVNTNYFLAGISFRF